MIDGIIDISHHNASVDLRVYKEKGNGIAVILKATQGTSFVDNKFVSRVMAASALGLLVGAYHFCDASSPTEQVVHFLRVTRDVPDLLLAIDVEANSVDGGTVSIEQAADIASKIQTITGTAPVVYCGRYGPDGEGTGFPNSVLRRSPLWISHYTAKAKPTLPLGWDTWALWQWTESGESAGVAGPVDLNRFNGSEAELRQFWAERTGKCRCSHG